MSQQEKKDIVPATPRALSVNSINITPAQQERINIGDVESFKGLIKNPSIIGNVTGIVWNEEKICVITDVTNLVLQFTPEINPGVSIFMQRKSNRRNYETDTVIWGGEFDTVQFTKQDLIKFLKTYSDGLPPALLKEIQKTKIQERISEDEELISLDGDIVRTTTETALETNVPKKFSIMMPLIYDITGKPLISGSLDFELAVGKKSDDYGRKTNQRTFLVTCTNGRKVLQGMMHQILDNTPKEIPKYYGNRALVFGNSGR
jgi:hypothetical protein